MTKIERTILSPKIKQMREKHTEDWLKLKEQINDYGYQSFYPIQGEFITPIKRIILSLSNDEKITLINEWKSKKDRFQFSSDEEYLKQYEIYIMEELVLRASKATYWM